MKYFTKADLKKENFRNKQKRAEKIISFVKNEYKSPRTALTYKHAHELLISVILSAQCTDDRVNQVTPKLFNRFKSVSDFSNANPVEIEKLIFSTGFYKNKTKNIIACCKKLIENFNGIVPSTMEELISLPGVGRKTANCVLSENFNKVEGIVVDTHIYRISKRLGFSNKNSAENVEKDLMKLINRHDWYFYGSALILHGRKLCKARSPICKDCNLKYLCPSREVSI